MSVVKNHTLLARIKNGQVAKYPCTMADVKREWDQVSFLVENESDIISGDFGYEVVVLVPQPAGDVIIERDPVFIDGQWVQQWEVRSFTASEAQAVLADRKEQLEQEISLALNNALDEGFAFNFGTPEAPELGNIQLRNGDLVKITGSGLRADRLIAKGSVDATMPFRTFQNEVKMCTPLKMAELSDQAYDAYLILIGISWQLKDAAAAATTVSELPVVPAKLVLPEDWRNLLAGRPA